MSRCLYCYQQLALPYSEAQMLGLAETIVRQHMTVTGVQPKLSLSLVPGSATDGPARLTIVGALGGSTC